MFSKNLSSIPLIYRSYLSCVSDNSDSLAVLSLLREIPFCRYLVATTVLLVPSYQLSLPFCRYLVATTVLLVTSYQLSLPFCRYKDIASLNGSFLSLIRAGLWGDYRKCDTPERTIRSMYEHINRQHPVGGMSEIVA